MKQYQIPAKRTASAKCSSAKEKGKRHSDPTDRSPSSERKAAIDELGKSIFPQWFEYQDLISHFDEYQVLWSEEAKECQLLGSRAAFIKRSLPLAEHINLYFIFALELEEDQNIRVSDIIEALHLAREEVKYLESVPDNGDSKQITFAEKRLEDATAKARVRNLRDKLALEAALSGKLVEKLENTAAAHPFGYHWHRTSNNDFLEKKFLDLEANVRRAKLFMTETILNRIKLQDQNANTPRIKLQDQEVNPSKPKKNYRPMNLLTHTTQKRTKWSKDCDHCNKQGHGNEHCPKRVHNRCSICKHSGHFKSECRHRKPCEFCTQLGHAGRCHPKDVKDESKGCTFCGGRGHKVEECPKIFRCSKVEHCCEFCRKRKLVPKDRFKRIPMEILKERFCADGDHVYRPREACEMAALGA